MSEGAINEESIAANFWMENRMSGHRQWSEREDCESDVAKFLNRIKAEAWDEGWRAFFSYAASLDGDSANVPKPTANPYREDT